MAGVLAIDNTELLVVDHWPLRLSIVSRKIQLGVWDGDTDP